MYELFVISQFVSPTADSKGIMRQN